MGAHAYLLLYAAMEIEPHIFFRIMPFFPLFETYEIATDATVNIRKPVHVINVASDPNTDTHEERSEGGANRHSLPTIN